jgi:hypothetical protein
VNTPMATRRNCPDGMTRFVRKNPAIGRGAAISDSQRGPIRAVPRSVARWKVRPHR